MGSVVSRQIGYLRLQVLDFEMGVSLSCRHPSVAQQLLHRPQVGPGTQGMSSEGVAQQVWAGAVGDIGRAQVAVH